MRGQNPRVLKSGVMPEETYQQPWAAIKAGKEWRGEFHNKKKNGEFFWEAASISPVRSPDGRITHYVAVKEDITEQKRMEAAARIHMHQSEALRATTADLTRELDLTPLLHLLIARAAELVGASSATVYLWEPAQAMMVPAAWHGLGEWQATIRHAVGQGIGGTVAEIRQGVLANDYRTSRYANPVTLQHTTVTASLGEPLLYREELIGAVTLNHEGGRTFTAEDRPKCPRAFGKVAAGALRYHGVPGSKVG